jgi:hypothetical protein
MLKQRRVVLDKFGQGACRHNIDLYDNADMFVQLRPAYKELH